MTIDPLAGSSWSTPATVDGFNRAQPNAVLMQCAAGELERSVRPVALDIGCGAGRNAVPLAEMGWRVYGTDLSWPMLAAAAERAGGLSRGRLHLALAAMERLPVRDSSVDLVIAHGIWNLARSGGQFRRAVAEAARVAKPGAALFVFTFSRNTLPASAEAVSGESFVFTQFSGEPQCFLREEQLVAELGGAGFVLDPDVPIREYNRPTPGMLRTGSAPVIYEALFRRVLTPT